MSAVWAVGLTGGIGAGKSTVADLFAQLGVTIVDTDAIAHALTGPQGHAMPRIADVFGPDFLLPSGALDRARMRNLVFADATQRVKLEHILHPMIRDEVEQASRASRAPYVMVVVPLLVETLDQWRSRVQRICVVDVDESEQLQRVVARSGWAASQVRAVMSVQATREERLAAADDVIQNSGAAEALADQVGALHERYLGYAQVARQ